DGDAAEIDAAKGGLRKPDQTSQQGRLARAVRTDHAQDPAAPRGLPGQAAEQPASAGDAQAELTSGERRRPVGLVHPKASRRRCRVSKARKNAPPMRLGSGPGAGKAGLRARPTVSMARMSSAPTNSDAGS